MLQLQNPESVIEPLPLGYGRYAARVPLLRAAGAQFGAVAAILMLFALFPLPTEGPATAMALAAVQGCLAAALGRLMGMEIWWLPIHALFAPGLLWVHGLDLPYYFPLGAFCVLASIFWGVSGTRVPLFLSSRGAALALADLLPSKGIFTFLDLGSGLGGVITHLADAKPGGIFHGIEVAPMPYLLSRLRVVGYGKNCRVSWGDFQDLDLACYDVVYAYLSPAAMGDLWTKARREMRAGSLLISNSFVIPGVPPSLSVPIGASGDSRLLLWRM